MSAAVSRVTIFRFFERYLCSTKREKTKKRFGRHTFIDRKIRKRIIDKYTTKLVKLTIKKNMRYEIKK